MQKARGPLPSSNRTCTFLASGSRRDLRLKHAQAEPTQGNNEVKPRRFIWAKTVMPWGGRKGRWLRRLRCLQRHHCT